MKKFLKYVAEGNLSRPKYVESYTLFVDQKMQYIMMSILPKCIYEFNVILIKIPADCLNWNLQVGYNNSRGNIAGRNCQNALK